jgi:hypothetical protein
MPANHKHNPIIMHPATAISDDEGGVEDNQEDSWASIGEKRVKAYANSHDVAARAYHADNGIFRAHRWVDCCIKEKKRGKD